MRWLCMAVCLCVWVHIGDAIASEPNLVEAALGSLRSQQSDDGSWIEQASTGFTPDPARVTGLAILAYLGAGYDHMTPNKYRRVVKAGLDWLVAQQGQDGRIGVSVADHATAAMALAEAYGMTNDPGLRGPAQSAADCLRRWQHAAAHPGAGAWPVQVPDGDQGVEVRIDVSTTRWATMAIKSGKAAGLDVGNCLQHIDLWLTRTLAATSSEHLAEHGVAGAFIAAGEMQAAQADVPESTAAMSAIAIFVGRTAGDPQLERLVERLRSTRMAAVHAGDPLRLSHDYAVCLTLFQHQTHWQDWLSAYRDRVFQVVRDPAHAAAMVPVGWSDGTSGGGITNQLLATMTAEVIYRYDAVR